MDEKLRLYSLTFLPIFATFSKIEKVANIGRKGKAIIALLFWQFLPLSKIEKVANIGRKGKAGFFPIFASFSKI
jgi:hypothetical protein